LVIVSLPEVSGIVGGGSSSLWMYNDVEVTMKQGLFEQDKYN
jgi:hypothetical protein